MAGAGSKKFAANSKLTSDDVNNYLADQVVMRFATTTARDNAFGGTGKASLAQGMLCYIDADKCVYSYNGSAWVKVTDTNAAYQNPTGLELITPTTVAGSGVTLSGAVVSFSTSSSVSVNGCFSSLYTNYRIVATFTGSSGGMTLRFNLRYNGTDNGGSYSNVGQYWYLSGGSGYSNITPNQANTFFTMGGIPGSTARGGLTVDCFEPNVTTLTTVQYNCVANTANSGAEWYTGGGVHYTAYQADGFTLSASTNNMTGSIRVYGYRNS